MHRMTSDTNLVTSPITFGNWKPKGKEGPPVLIGTARVQELKQHLLHGGVNTSLSGEEATWPVRYQGECPPTSTRARLLGTSGPSSGI